MRTKILSFALMLSLTAVLGACDGGGADTTTPSGTTATTPAEPADSGATTPPVTTTTPATTNPTPTTSP